MCTEAFIFHHAAWFAAEQQQAVKRFGLARNVDADNLPSLIFTDIGLRGYARIGPEDRTDTAQVIVITIGRVFRDAEALPGLHLERPVQRGERQIARVEPRRFEPDRTGRNQQNAYQQTATKNRFANHRHLLR